VRIDVYLDNNKSPIASLKPPKTFRLDTTKLNNGKHDLTFKATEEQSITSVRVVPFFVQNGPSIDIHGITDNDKLHGEISILANAYGSSAGDEFEPIRMETPKPIPTWAWVLFLSILAWGAGYISLEIHSRINPSGSTSQPTYATSISKQEISENSVDGGNASWQKLGLQVYGNNCSSCHQATGTGLPSVFPPLKGNSAVLANDPTVHINAVLYGVVGKTIDGVAYASPMPAFGISLSDEEITAVINHERTQWGNNAKLITPAEVAELRK